MCLTKRYMLKSLELPNSNEQLIPRDNLSSVFYIEKRHQELQKDNLDSDKTKTPYERMKDNFDKLMNYKTD